MNRFLRNLIAGLMLVTIGLWAQDVTVSISEAGDDYVDIHMTNVVDVGGFQFTIADNPNAFDVTGAAGGSAGANGFIMSSSPGGLVLGFSLTGAVIPPGDGLLCTVAINPNGLSDFSQLSLTGIIFSDAGGGGLTYLYDQDPVNWGEPPVDPPEVIINSPSEGEVVYSLDVDVNLTAAHLVEGDHFHAYLDGALEGMYYSNNFTMMGVPYGPHELTVTVADATHTDYENPEAADTVNFENMEQTLEGYTLYLGSGEVLAGETVDIDLSLTNEGVVGGFQLQLMDFPDYADVIAVATTDRTSGFSVSSNEQPDGSLLVVGFDLTLTGISAGEGPILTLTYLSTGIYDSELDLWVDEPNSILSDLIGNPIMYMSEGGTLIIDGEDAPDVFAPENLDAVGGFEMVNLLWTHPEPWTVVNYYIYRDGVQVGTSTATNYTDAGLETEVEYCYTVVAASEFNVSEHSNEACAMTLAEFFEPPQNLTAEENGLEITLTWQPPEGIVLIDCPADAPYPDWDECYQWVIEIDPFCCDVMWDGICEQEYQDCLGGYEPDPGDYDPELWEVHQDYADNYNEITRDLLGYEVYRDNVLLDFLEGHQYEYVDTSDELWYLETYCYNVTAVYDDPGTSGFSNTACAIPQLGAPSGLSAHGEGDFVQLNWTPHPDNAQTSFYIYKDGEFLAETTETTYDDNEAEHDVEYCYIVTGYYDGIGESPATGEACGMWSLCPPGYFTAEEHDMSAYLSWDETSCGEEVFMQYDDGILANAFYFYDSYDMGYAHGMRFDVGTNFDVLAASLYILSEGDAYWPWPNGTHGPVDVMVFDDNNGLPGNLLFQDTATAEDGWATVYPNLTGMSGAFHVVASHDPNWADAEGFGIDGGVDHPGNMVTMQNGAWTTGDVLFYGGDYMIAALINAFGQIMPMTYSDLPTQPFTEFDAVNSVELIDGIELADTATHPSFYQNELTRELLSYDIWRDGGTTPLVTLDPAVFEYWDMDLTNMQEYCYTMTANYTEGASEPTDPRCVTPIPGYAPTDLTADDLGGTIALAWVEPLPLDTPVLMYNVYRDGEFYDAAGDTSYNDTEPVAGVEYCYTVTAVYVSGESYPSNAACATYVLDPPVGVSTEGMDEAQGIMVNWNAPGSFVYLTIEILTDSFGGEVSWELTAADGTLIQQVFGGTLTSNTFYEWEIELFPGTYTFSIHDSFGDGICCAYGEGYYNLILNDNIIATGGDYGSGENVVFDTSDGILAISQTWYTEPVPYEKGTELTEAQISELEIGEPVYSFGPIEPSMSRDLLVYQVFRDGDFLVETDITTFEYFDAYPSAMNDTEYCYYVVAVYDEGNSIPSNTSCNQWRLPAPSELVVLPIENTLALQWVGAPGGAIEYTVYRDGEFYDSTEATSYTDMDAMHDVLYCYEVRAVHDLGESGPTNEACNMWMILPPVGVLAEAGPPTVAPNTVHLSWIEPGTALCSDEDIYTLPFNSSNTNVGMGDDWPVQGSQGEDFAYGLYLTQATVIDITLCEAETNYDTKLEVFTADFDCVPTTTGYYDDDATCAISGLYSSLWGVSLEAGQYYIVVDGYAGGTGNFGITVSEANGVAQEPTPVEELIALESEKSGIPLTIDDWTVADGSGEATREFLGYNIYRDGEFLVLVDPGTLEYDDTPVDNCTEYCYYVTASYTEGESPASNETCAIPLPGSPPTDLSARGENDYISLEWTAPMYTENDVMYYTIYRDGEELAQTNDLTYQDSETIHDTEYCYEVLAMYPADESCSIGDIDCTMWELCPPSHVEATPWDRQVDLTWEETQCGEEVFLQYDDGVLANAFYFYDTYDMGYAHGMRFDVGTSFDVLAASLYILSEGDAYWPWPNGTHGPVEVLVFDDNNGIPGNLLYQESATAVDGWATVYPNITGLDGSFHVVATHEANWADAEGFGIDGSVDHPNNMVTLQNGSWSTGDVLFYGGDYMIAALVYAQGYEAPLAMDFGDLPSDPFTNFDSVASLPADMLAIENDNYTRPPFAPQMSRELENYTIFRDEMELATLAPDVYEYVDTFELENWTEYCYTMVANYTEGPSQPTGAVCATPWVPSPMNLVAEATTGLISLDWDAPDDWAGPVFEYIIYRDGEFYDNTQDVFYNDTDTEPGIDYCYTVTALFDGGESMPTEESCAMWDVCPPTSVNANGVDEAQGIHVTWNDPACESEFLIEMLTDNYGGEVSWELTFEDGTLIGSVTGGSLSSSSSYEWPFVLEPGTYTFSIHDSFGDGICCAYGEGYYNLILNGTTIHSGGDYGAGETIVFNTGDALLSMTQFDYAIDVPWSKGDEVTPEMIAEIPVTENVVEFEQTQTRDLISYEINRNGEYYMTVGPDEMEFWDIYPATDPGMEYCYAIRGVYDEGISEFSPESCDMWVLAQPTNLVAEASGSDIQLTWDTAGDPQLLEYIVYRDDEFYASTTDTAFLDENTIHDVEYCYYVTGIYEIGESLPTDTECTMWQLCPPSHLAADPGDAYIDLTWEEVACGEEVYIQYDDGVLANAFYFYDSYDMGYAHGMRFDVSPAFDVLAASVYILSEGDAYWPWPNGTHGPVDVMIFDDAGGMPGNLLYQESVTAVDGWATVVPGGAAAGLSGSFYIIASHDAGWADAEGFGIDGSVDHPNNMYTMQSGTWSTGDVLFYGGDYMMSALVNAQGWEGPMAMNFGDLPSDPYEGVSQVASAHDGSGTEAPGQVNIAPYAPQNNVTRDLLFYTLYRDGEILMDNIDIGVFSYRDDDLVNGEEHCYAMSATYDEGESPMSDPAVCESAGVQAYNLIAIPGPDNIILTWEGAPDAMEFVIYRDGEELDRTPDHMFEDNTSVPGEYYCYNVTANYPIGGESAPTMDTEDSCAQWNLEAVSAWIETAGYQTLEVAWTDPGAGGLCGDENITALPFNTTGTNVGMGDEWPVQGSQGEDYTFGFYTPSDIVIDITLCEPETNYDTKLEVFTADDDCVPTTTGYYDDDATCQFSNLYSSLLGVALEAGQYYIVVDGFGGGTGNFGITVTEAGGLASAPADVNESIAWEAEKTGMPLSIEDWNIADQAPEDDGPTMTRSLIGFDIERDGEFLVQAGANDRSYVDTGLINGTTYCYTVQAVYDEGLADQSNEACGEPISTFDEPYNFMLSIVDGVPYAHMSWSIPGGAGHDGFNIYRDDAFLTWVPAGTNMYDDADVVFWQEYCWRVAATYEGGLYESNLTDPLCGAVPDPGDFSVLSIESGSVAAGEEITLSIDLANQFNVAGFQFTLADVPDILEVTNVAQTPRTSENDGWAVQSNAQPDGSIIVVGFNLLGDSIEVGEGAILEVTFMSETVLLTTEVVLDIMDAFLGDEAGNPLPMFAQDGMLEVVPAGAVELYVGGGDMYVGDTGSMDISMTNEQPVSGFQFLLTHTNPIMQMIDVETTERTAGWVLNISPATGVVIGFNLSGIPIAIGEGPIMNINMIAIEEGEDMMCVDDAIISDPLGFPMPVTSECGMMTVMPFNPDETQYVELSPFMNNLFSFRVEQPGANASGVFADNLFIGWNDSGQFYVPSFEIDQIGDLVITDAYGGFVAGTQPRTLEVTGTPADAGQTITWSPFMNNMFAYLPAMGMSASEAFSAYDASILIISNDSGDFYVPSLGVNTMDSLLPGEGYKVFVMGPNAVDFVWPTPMGLTMDAGASMIRDYKEASRSDQYMIAETGLPYAIIVTNADGAVQTGDELVAYADGIAVGATKVVDLNQPIVITAWEGYDNYGIELPGFTVGDEIELRLYSAVSGEELRVDANLDANYFGVAPLTSGSITVYNQAAIPTEFTLSQNYPNPFNPNTTIEFSVPADVNITLNVFDIMGRQVTSLINGQVTSGYHQVVWDGMDSNGTPVSAGMYIYALQGEGVSMTRKMVMIK